MRDDVRPGSVDLFEMVNACDVGAKVTSADEPVSLFAFFKAPESTPAISSPPSS
jgi:hypothetical protein